ncbi:MAG: endonuclease III [Luteitalea sp.]|nr:endonuclease III [Luteitalea sp.]
MRTLKKAILSMELPAIEKISEEQEGDAFQVLIGTMLSAQTRDRVTHEASTRLFAVAPTPDALMRLPLKRIERLIYPVSFYRNKARHVKAASRRIMEEFAGHIPATMEELLTLPGVGRKTATLTLIVAHESTDHICVDTHVHRIANRFGWVRTKTPEQTELALYEAVPKRWWADVNLFLVSWGQNVCKPVYPLCRTCPLDRLCPKVGVRGQGSGQVTR